MKYPHEYLPPEVWDQIFKPRGPFGLLSGRTVLDAIPGVSQGLAYQDYRQSAREGDKLGQTLSGVGMLPGGGFFKGMKGPIRKIADKLDDVIVEFRGEKFRFPPGTDPIKAQQELWTKVAGPRARGAEEVVDNYPSDLPDETFDNLMAPEKADVIPFPVPKIREPVKLPKSLANEFRYLEIDTFDPDFSTPEKAEFVRQLEQGSAISGDVALGELSKALENFLDIAADEPRGRSAAIRAAKDILAKLKKN